MTESDAKALWRQELAEIEAGDDDELDFRPRPRRSRREEPSQVYSIRIPVSYLERLRVLADSRGTRPTALVRDWVIDRIDAETAQAQARPRRQARARELSSENVKAHAMLTLYSGHSVASWLCEHGAEAPVEPGSRPAGWSRRVHV